MLDVAAASASLRRDSARAAPYSTSPLRLSRRVAQLASKRCSVPKARTGPPARRNTLPHLYCPPQPSRSPSRGLSCYSPIPETLLLHPPPVCSALHRCDVARALPGQHTNDRRRRRRRQPPQAHPRRPSRTPASSATHACIADVARPLCCCRLLSASSRWCRAAKFGQDGNRAGEEK